MHVFPLAGRAGRTRTPTTCSGWPDLVLWKRGRCLVVELKSETGRLRPEQRDVLDSLAAAGIEV